MEILSKIALKQIGVQPKPNKVTEAEELATIYGVVSGYKTGTGTYGEFIKFIGDFRALRTTDGEEFRSGYLLLPGTLPEMLRVAVDKSDGNGVQFGVLIGVKPSDVPCGYEYTVRPLTNTDVADPLAALHQEVRAALNAHVQKSLPKPKDKK